MLAEEFVRQGHSVTLVTPTPSDRSDHFPFPVIRRPRPRQLLHQVETCDVYLQSHVSLRTAWPLLVHRRAWVASIQTWIPRSGIKGRTKHFVLRWAVPISCSSSIAAHLRRPSKVIANPYDDSVFREMPENERSHDLLFVGRLSGEKGVGLLLEALHLLGAQGLRPKLTVVGPGPDSETLAAQAARLGLVAQVEFVGPKDPQGVARLMSEHKILVVPSLYHEPFGIVALEAIACGCLVVGSEGGGLKDAIGQCGLTFPNGDAGALARCLAGLMGAPDSWQGYMRAAPSHLRAFTRSNVACAYLQVLEAAYDATHR